MKWAVSGHERQKAYIERLLNEASLSHAYLFAGPEGIGKRMMAEDIVRVLVPQGYELDVMRLSPVADEETGKIKDIPVEAVRDLKSWIALRPLGAYKAVIIDDVERLGDEAANTLLKVLEEPPAYAKFFLVTGTPGRVMPTVASRCERVDFQTPPGRQLPPLTPEARDLAAALKGTAAQKIGYAKILAENEDAHSVVTLLLHHVHAMLPEKPYLAPAAHGLLDLLQVLSESHYNRRLAIERFLLSVPVLHA
jgi:DNA polymerase-3 subunit delta'